ncbi:MAG TPA: hypothetical protein VNI83_03225, partial [Vicinamibacterales bacterium]|nr:hypothetical protein [Vicinamibacterales bacterium]
DPLEISRDVLVLANEDRSLRQVAGGRERGAVRPSELGHSSVPFESSNAGLTIDYAEQTTTLSLICLRRLRFPLGGQADPEVDVAARTVLAALGLTAATLAFEAGGDLRSRCLLWPDGPMSWELLDRPGVEPAQYSLTTDGAIALLNGAVSQAREKGLPWPDQPLVLRPSRVLLELVRLSQIEAKRKGVEAS